MLFTGELTIDNQQYLFQACMNNVRTKWVIYTTHSKRDLIALASQQPTQDIVIDSRDVLASPTGYKDYVVSSIIFSKSGKQERSYGNIRLLERVVTAYTKANTDKTLEVQTHYDYNKLKDVVVGFSLPNITMEMQFYDESTSSIKEIKDLAYQDNFTINNKSNKTLHERIRASSAKTLDELKNTKDLTWTKKKDYKIINTQESLQQVLAELQQYTYLAVDTETTGLNICSLPKDHPSKDHLVGVCLSWKVNQGIYIPVDHTEFPNLDLAYVIEQLKPVLESKKLILHNAIFDGKVFLDNGIRIKVYADTMVLAYHLNPEVSKGSKGLKALTSKLYGDDTIELEDIFGKKDDAGLFRYCEEELVKYYACADADYTYRLYFDLIKQLPQNQVKLFGLDMQMLTYLYKSEYYGNKVDLELLNTLSEVNNRDLAVLEETMYRYVGQVGLLTQARDNFKEQGLTKEEIEEKLSEIRNDPNFSTASYQFKISSPDQLARVMYTILKYPVLRETSSGKPSVDKFTIKDLLKEKATHHSRWLTEDLASSICDYNFSWLKSKDKVLISASEFNKSKYPFALLLQAWRKKEKLRTAFFAELIEHNTDGFYYTGFKPASTATARIVNRIQTLIGHLKRLIVPYSEDYYMIVFDYAQIEYRVMAGLANTSRRKGEEPNYDDPSDVIHLVEKLMNPEADYHREGGAGLMGTTPEDMTKEQRSDIKSVNFAVPYGMGAFSLAERKHGRTDDPMLKRKYQEEAEILLQNWYKFNWQIKMQLDLYRQCALTPLPDSKLPDGLKGQTLGVTVNPWGRRRYYDLADIDEKGKGRVRRQAGNYPIQSFARDLFVAGFVRLNKRLEKEGLYDKVFIPNLVHDEMVCIVHRSIPRYKMYQYIWEECILHLKGHPTYFAGINIVENWYQGKDDLYEAPVEFVEQIVNKVKSNQITLPQWETNPCQDTLKDILEYMRERYVKEFKALQPSLSPQLVDLASIMPKFKNYFLKPRLCMYFPPLRDLADTPDDNLIASIERVLYEYWQSPFRIRYPQGQEKVITSPLQASEASNTTQEIESDIKEKEEEQEDEFYMLLDNDEDTQGFSFSVKQQEEKEDFKEIARSTATDRKEVWECIDFGTETQIFTPDDLAIFVDNNYQYVVDITGCTNKQFSDAVEYLSTCTVDKTKYRLGICFKLCFKHHNKLKPTDYYVMGVDREVLASKLGKNFIKGSL